MFKKIALMAGAVSALGLATPTIARADSDPQNLVAQARITVDDARRDKEFGTAPDLLRRARAVLIVPTLFKGGFFVGGEGGTGVMLERHGNTWSYPAFYTMASASFGLQIGAQTSELILFALTDRARHALLQNQFKIGAEAGLAVVTLGSSAEAATTSNLNADIVVWASSSGAYAGLTVNGSIIKPRNEYNQDYYGTMLTSAQIVGRNGPVNHGADGLRAALAGHG